MYSNSVRIRVAAASLNQTVYDFAANVQNVCAAIDRAAANGADILALEELVLTGYAADDYHQWNKANDIVWSCVQHIARYAQDKNPNLVISLGAPWHYADKTQSADTALYNIENLPYNTQFTITDGRVVAIAAKSILSNGPVEYERRHFASWPAAAGKIIITLPDGTQAPFGKPVIVLSDGVRTITMTHEICAEAWPGVYADEINIRESQEARYLVGLSCVRGLTVVLNPSASKPEPSSAKDDVRMQALCAAGSRYCELYVYTNCLGSASGIYAAEGNQIFARDGVMLHHQARYSFDDMSYSSVTVELPCTSVLESDAPTAHQFSELPLEISGAVGAFDLAYENGTISAAELSYEEYMRSIALWLRDYMRKQTFACQGYVVSLSGGKDSAYGALAVMTMVDLEIRAGGIDGFFRHFKHLNYQDKVLKIWTEQGEAAAIQVIKENILTCVYMPTDNSSTRTQHAARFLIEGGMLPDGKNSAGIGGKFHVADVQGIWDETLAAFTGLGFPLPNWQNQRDDLLLQNMQARIRAPLPWAISNHEGKIALATSNESEAALGYTTAGGDLHMGGANPIGGMPKEMITQSLRYFEEKGLVSSAPVPALHYINLEIPTAELRHAHTGQIPQSDENDLGFSYAQSEFIETYLLVRRKTPQEVYRRMRVAQLLFPDDPARCRDVLIQFAVKRWPGAQFKRFMSPIAPHVGNNVDPHQSVRTPVLGDHFNTGCALMTLDAMSEILGGQTTLEKHFGKSLDQLESGAILDQEFKAWLIHSPMEKLLKIFN